MCTHQRRTSTSEEEETQRCDESESRVNEDDEEQENEDDDDEAWGGGVKLGSGMYWKNEFPPASFRFSSVSLSSPDYIIIIYPAQAGSRRVTAGELGGDGLRLLLLLVYSFRLLAMRRLLLLRLADSVFRRGFQKLRENRESQSF